MWLRAVPFCVDKPCKKLYYLTMIKLVVSDLDGTLLLPGGILPDETFELIEKLHDKGIIFAPASGRQLPNLKKLFAPVLDKIAIIAENGGLAYFDGQVIFSYPTPAKDALYALDIIDKVEGIYPLLSCEKCAYYVSDFPPFVEKVQASYSSCAKAQTYEEVLNRNTLLKISVWDTEMPCAEHGGKILPPLIKGLRTMVSGRDWLDVSVSTANKGEALKALQSRLGIIKEECMGFGDHMNDLELLQNCGEAYVTANAFAGLKSYIPDEVPSNADMGVIQKIKELL